MSIVEHPEKINNRSRVGYWKIELVIKIGHTGAMQTIVEQVTRYTVTKRSFDKLERTVTYSTIELLAPFKDFILTISADNGKELWTIKRFQKCLIVVNILLIYIVLSTSLFMCDWHKSTDFK